MVDSLATVHQNCRGSSTCSVYSDAGIARNWTGECFETQQTRTNEFRVKYRCGKIVMDDVCVFLY